MNLLAINSTASTLKKELKLFATKKGIKNSKKQKKEIKKQQKTEQSNRKQ